MTNLELVAAELAAAKKKHTKFVDAITFYLPEVTSKRLAMIRRNLKETIEENFCDVSDVLRCEIYEAIDAYAHGDLANARQELAQCAAVCIRAMEHIEKEMEEKK